MKESLSFLLDIAIILLFANLGGQISKLAKQPAVLGQILAGLLLGPSLLNLVHSSVTISHMAEIGVILLMFIAGLETDIDDLKSSGKSSASIAAGGVILPLLLGVGVVFIMKPDGNIIQGLFLGIILTATSVSITVEALRDLGKLRSKQGIGILGAAIIDDVLGIVMLTVVIGIASPVQGDSLILVLLKVVGFFAIAGVLGYVFSKLLTKYSEIVIRENRVLTYALIFCFALAFIAEELGVAAVIGAYFTGVIFSTTPHRNRVSHEIQRIAYAIFTPIFFINIGLMVQLKNVTGAIALSVVVIIAAIVGKIVGCGIGAKLSKFSNRESLQIGIGMIPRSEVALIITNLGLGLGIIGDNLFTAIILMVLATTILTPTLLKLSFGGSSEGSKA